MQTLRVVGYWGSEQHSEYPDPRAFVDESWDADVREFMQFYLERGLTSRAYMGYSACRMCEKRDNGNLEYTDGTYVWPQGLAHYVREHAVRLPEEFVEHAFATGERLAAAELDLTWWLAQG